MTDVRDRCSGCGQEVDETTCWCGDAIPPSGHDNHIALPMGCKCLFVVEDPLRSFLSKQEVKP